MNHVFIATKIGWKEEQEIVYFDSTYYTKEEAESQFVPYEGITERGYPYTGFEFDGQKYHHFKYIGEFEDDNMPHSIDDICDYNLGRI